MLAEGASVAGRQTGSCVAGREQVLELGPGKDLTVAVRGSYAGIHSLYSGL